MTCLPATPSAPAAQATRASATGSQTAERADDLYAAWTSIFEGARPAEPARAHVGTEARSIDRAPEVMRPENIGGLAGEPGADCPATGRARPLPSPGEAAEVRKAPVHVMSSETTGVITAVPGGIAPASNEPGADTALRIHYVRALSTSFGNETHEEMVSVVLNGSEVSITVRDPGLTEAEALRIAFQTARELTGRSAALNQLTLNGAVLYQQTNAAEASSQGLLFAC